MVFVVQVRRDATFGGHPEGGRHHKCCFGNTSCQRRDQRYPCNAVVDDKISQEHWVLPHRGRHDDNRNATRQWAKNLGDEVNENVFHPLAANFILCEWPTLSHPAEPIHHGAVTRGNPLWFSRRTRREVEVRVSTAGGRLLQAIERGWHIMLTIAEHGAVVRCCCFQPSDIQNRNILATCLRGDGSAFFVSYEHHPHHGIRKDGIDPVYRSLGA
ncbi:unnamed protein product [Ectocarpus sp. 12 AP-2014]